MISNVPNYFKVWTDYNNLVLRLLDPLFDNPVAEYIADKQVDILLKMYYWPAFMAGNMDNWSDIMKPYNICRPYK
jgi:hypothetical protein